MDEQALSEKEIFYAALELPDARKRSELLDSACQGNLALRRQVEDLLAAHQEDILQAPAAAAAEPREAPDPDVYMGQTIGNYKLLEKIGEGGFGVVYMADQLVPIERRVALKIIKAGMDTKQVVARFEAERQALALMDHPNIAKVLEAGATNMGRPYFVMELVRGVPVTKYCDDRSLSTQERLNIFTEVCAAVQHAHQKGIIHRDIKPTNILVTTDGDRPVPKVIDFGIAKATRGRLTDKTLFTHFRQFMGTPAYMSPEQAEMSAADVDTRSDIYSLGVLLYELLTGKTPLDSSELLHVGFDDVCRRICHEEPPKPSTRLSSLTREEQTTIANHRRTEPERLGHLIRGDLDWIVMKALEKDRTRRYETANALRMDIQRFLVNEPVSAVAPSAAYRMSKFVRRNVKSIIVAAVFLVLLVLGTVAATWEAVRARQQSRRAVAAEQDARTKSFEAIELGERARAGELRARRRQYAAEMIVAQRRLGGLNSKNVWELLHRNIPQEGEPDFRGFEWRSLWNQYSRELFTLAGHTDEMRSLAFSPDGNWLASGSTDGTARLWNLATRREVWRFPGGTHCNRVEFSPDGKWLLTHFWRGDDKLWDVVDPANPREVRNIEANGVFSSDGKTLVGGGNPLKQWSLTGEVLREYVDPSHADEGTEGRTHLGRIWSWVLSPDGSRLITAGGDSRVKIWSTATGELLFVLHGDTTDVFSAAFSPNDRDVIVTVSGRGAFRVWDRTGKELYSRQLGETPLDHVEFSKDGKSLVISERYGRLRVLETETWTETSVFDSPGGANLLRCSPSDANLVATAAMDGVIRFWDISPTDSILDHPSPVRSLEFAPNGRMLAVGMANGVVQFWDIPKKSKVFTTKMTEKVNPYAFRPMALTAFKPDFVAFSSDSDKAAVIGPDRTVTVWDLEKRKPEAEIHSLRDDAPFWSVAFSPDGMRVYTGTAGSKGEQGVFIWDLQNPVTPIAKLDHPGDYGVGCLAISPDGQTLASGHIDVKLWDVPKRRTLRSLEFPGRNDMERGPLSLCFSPDGNWLAAGDVADSVWLWDTRTWEHRLLSLRDYVLCVDFSPEGDRIVAADCSGMTKLWDLGTQQVVATYHGSVADFSPDGRILAIGCEDRLSSHALPVAGRVRLYYAPSLAEIDERRAQGRP